MSLGLQLWGIVLGILATVGIYKDYKNKEAPNWLTIPFMTAFGILTIVVILDIPFDIL